MIFSPVARKDVNGVSTLCGVSDLDGSVMPIQIDPVTGGILAKITVVSNDTPIVSTGWAQKDVNGSATILGVADDGSGLLTLAIYNINKQLFANITEA